MSDEKLRTIQLYTDGACSGNPGPGGWAFVLRDVPTGKETEKAGYVSDTTNNRMELQAVIEGLSQISRRCSVEIYSDSKYVLQGLESWMAGWKRRNWKKAGGGAVKNAELWKELDSLQQLHKISFHYVPGHSGHPENERCDELAVAAYQNRSNYENTTSPPKNANYNTASCSKVNSPRSNTPKIQGRVDHSLKHDMLECCLWSIERSAAILTEHFRSSVKVSNKAPADLVTNADVEAESSIIETIKEYFPDHAILAEESHGRGDRPLHPTHDKDEAAGDDHLWIVDPLDGTNNFAHHIDHFAISIAYAKNGVVECGAIYKPVTDDLFLAVKGQGAWWNDKPIQCSEDPLEESLVGVGFYYDRGEMMQATLNAIGDLFRNGMHGVRRFGTASLDLSQLAAGSLGGYFEFQLKPWDFAAGSLLTSESGGTVTDCFGQELNCTQSSSICSGNPLVHSKLLEMVGPHFRELHAD